MENPYHEIFREFEKTGVQYVIVGGIAVNLHGYSRFTGDLDVILALNEENLEKVSKIMKKLGYTERLPIDVKDLAKEDQVRNWLEKKNMTAYAYVSYRLPQLSLDIIVSHSLRFDEFEGRKDLKRSWGMALPVISINDLIGMKREANREKDMADIDNLLELQGL